MKTQTSAVLLALCLGASGASLASADSVASLSAREDAFSAHQHSEDLLRFMRKHGKKYCEGESACEVSVLRERVFNLNKEVVDAHNANPGASPPAAPTASSRTRRNVQHPVGVRFPRRPRRRPSSLFSPSHPDRGFNMEMGRFSDLSEEEFVKNHLKYRPSSEKVREAVGAHPARGCRRRLVGYLR